MAQHDIGCCNFVMDFPVFLDFFSVCLANACSRLEGRWIYVIATVCSDVRELNALIQCWLLVAAHSSVLDINLVLKYACFSCVEAFVG